MFITRKGKYRDHGIYNICSTSTDCHAGIVWKQLPSKTEKPKHVALIRVSLDNDLERRGGGEHTHFAHIELVDFFQMAKALFDEASDSDTLKQEIARCLGGNMTLSEKGRLATTALQLLTSFIKPSSI